MHVRQTDFFLLEGELSSRRSHSSSLDDAFCARKTITRHLWRDDTIHPKGLFPFFQRKRVISVSESPFLCLTVWLFSVSGIFSK